MQCVPTSFEDVSLACSEYSQYPSQVAVFGSHFQSQLNKAKLLVVGAGALGCETVKNLALMGVGADESGLVVVTDPDAIEISNLNRQFLFRPKHVGALKSVVACAAGQAMNPQWRVKPMTQKVCKETEAHVFPHSFWAGLHGVVNGLDNVQGRLYVDSKCVQHQLFMLEAGTLGTKANTLSVLPPFTESYASSHTAATEDPDQAIPACTLHAYPNLIDHCLTWARDLFFEKEFFLMPLEAKKFLDHPRGYEKELRKRPDTRLQRLVDVRSVLIERKLLI